MQELPHLATRRKIARICLFQKAYEGHQAVLVQNLLHLVALYHESPQQIIYSITALKRRVENQSQLQKTKQIKNATYDLIVKDLKPF